MLIAGSRPRRAPGTAGSAAVRALGAPILPASLAAGGCVREALLAVERLLSCGEQELRTAFDALENLILTVSHVA